MNAIDRLISVATNELGYLEKKSNYLLHEKTANAGGKNYTKYWEDVKPSYQCQPWCAAFVTWCMDEAFGKDMTKKLLGHYPFVYCPTLANLKTRYSNPKRGDIVLFYRKGTFVHTGIVTAVNGDYFQTIEGNTSGGNGIVANGGGVFQKGYYNSALPGTKFIRPDYSIIEEELTMNQYEELKKDYTELLETVKKLAIEVGELANPMIYNYIDSNMPEWARPTIQKLVNKGILKGTDKGLNLTDDLLRILVMNDRAGLYD